MDDRRDTAERAARAAGALAADYFRGPLSLTVKSDPLDQASQADREGEALIRQVILAAHPDDAIAGEELADERGRSQFSWLVDPIDGTGCFVAGLPMWCVSVACADADGPLIGVVYDPCQDEMWCAVRGQGMTLNGRPVIRRRPMPQTLEQAVACGPFLLSGPGEGRVLDHPALQHIGRMRDVGSAALSLCWVAAGRFDLGYWEYDKLSDHDVAAAALCCAEMGLRCGWVAGRDEHERRYMAGPAHLLDAWLALDPVCA